MNEYYIKFKGGGFSYTYAESYEDDGRDYNFIRHDTKNGKTIKVIVERWPKKDVEKIVTNPTFE